MKHAIFTGILIVVIIFAIFQSFQISALSKTINGEGGQQKTGESNEEMMARMHPEQARATSGQQTRYSNSQSPQMVGGC